MIEFNPIYDSTEKELSEFITKMDIRKCVLPKSYLRMKYKFVKNFGANPNFIPFEKCQTCIQADNMAQQYVFDYLDRVVV